MQHATYLLIMMYTLEQHVYPRNVVILKTLHSGADYIENLPHSMNTYEVLPGIYQHLVASVTIYVLIIILLLVFVLS